VRWCSSGRWGVVLAIKLAATVRLSLRPSDRDSRRTRSVWFEHCGSWYPSILEPGHRRDGVPRYWIRYAVPVDG
jgi:hypothetical protein